MRPSVGVAEARESCKIPFKAEQSSGVAALDWGGQGRQEDFLDPWRTWRPHPVFLRNSFYWWSSGGSKDPDVELEQSRSPFS